MGTERNFFFIFAFRLLLLSLCIEHREGKRGTMLGPIGKVLGILIVFLVDKTNFAIKK